MKPYLDHIDTTGLNEFLTRWYRKGFWFDMETDSVRDYVFGGLAGPTGNIFNLSHEVGHIIQMSPEKLKKRFKKGSLHFSYPEVWVYNRYVTEPQTDQISRCELETFVIQFRMLEAAGLATDFVEWMTNDKIYQLFSWLSDNHLFHAGAFKTTPEFIDFVNIEAASLLDKWSVDVVEARWKAIKLKD